MAQSRRSIAAGYRLEAYATLSDRICVLCFSNSFILPRRTPSQAFWSSYLLYRFNEGKGLIPQNFGYFLFRNGALPLEPTDPELVRR